MKTVLRKQKTTGTTAAFTPRSEARRRQFSSPCRCTSYPAVWYIRLVNGAKNSRSSENKFDSKVVVFGGSHPDSECALHSNLILKVTNSEQCNESPRAIWVIDIETNVSEPQSHDSQT